jgi:hypothetical protein
MRIEYDYSFDSSGKVFGKHYIETAPGDQSKVIHPLIGPEPVDLIYLVAAWLSGKVPMAGSGWDNITHHPAYPGKTCLEALVGEIVRLNDVEARKVLGV